MRPNRCQEVPGAAEGGGRRQKREATAARIKVGNNWTRWSFSYYLD